jgi:hypothetical protein
VEQGAARAPIERPRLEHFARYEGRRISVTVRAFDDLVFPAR